MNDFTDEPTSIAEARAHKANDATKWAPRDALIAALRDLDAGVTTPTRIAIVMSQPSDANGYSTSFYIAGTDTQGAIGLMEMAKNHMLGGG